MGAAGCRKNANFGGDSNPCPLKTPKFTKNGKKFACCGSRTTQNWTKGEHHATALQSLIRIENVLLMIDLYISEIIKEILE